MVKPALIAATNETGESEQVELVVNLTFTILTFISASTLAFATYNKKYKLLSLLSNIKSPIKVRNANYFSKLHFVCYIVTVTQTYLISILILVFLIESGNNLNRFNWVCVVYPPCGWLMVMKLYLNEVSHLINGINNNINFQNNINKIGLESRSKQNNILNVTNHDHEAKLGKISLHLRRLFLFQLIVVITSVISVLIYVDLIAKGEPMDKKNKQASWDTIWILQLVISSAMMIVIMLTMISSFVV